MSNFDLKSFMTNEGLTRVSRDRKKLNERAEESLQDYTYNVRAGHQAEDVWGRGMDAEDYDVFRDELENDTYIHDGNIKSWDEIEPGNYVIVSDAEVDPGEVAQMMGYEDVEDVPWTYSFTVSSHSNPYDNEGTLMYRIDQ